MTVTSGRKWLGLLQSYGLGGSLARMCEALLTNRWGSSAAYLTWKASATKPSHLLFQLSPSMPRTDATESGLLHTPTAAANQMAPSMCARDAGSWGLWPTPDTRGFTNKGSLQMLAKKASSPEEMSRMAYRAPAKMKQALWPTPTASSGLNGGSGSRKAAKARGMWPTPVAQDHKGQGMSRERRETREPDNLCSWTGKYEGSGALNPTWVEWLMGFPEGWTDLKPSEMPSSRKSSSKLDGQ